MRCVPKSWPTEIAKQIPMPIHRKSSLLFASNPEGQLSGFVGRTDARARFFRNINALHQTPNRVIFIHGDSGNGKSLLIRKLRSEDCILVPDSDRWQEVMDAARWNRLPAIRRADVMREVELARVDASCSQIPSALIDFAGSSQWIEDLREPLAALSELRRQLLAYGFRTPLFDFGIVLWLQKTGQLDRRNIQQFLGSTALDLIASAIETFGSVTMLSAVPKVLSVVFQSAFGQSLDEKLGIWLKKRHLDDEAEAIALSRLDARSELPLRLPELFARDINANLAQQWVKTSRVALFFDTHESFWSEHSRHDGTSSYHSRDEWLRRLVGALDLATGVIVVIAGREFPRWEDAPPPTQIPLEFIEALPLDGLSAVEATEFLQRVGIPEADQKQLIVECSARSTHCHPLFLALAAETVLMRSAAPDASGSASPLESLKLDGDLGRALLDRFLRYCDAGMEDAVRLLSAPRAFDNEMFFALAGQLNADATFAAYDRLCRFSFVYPMVQASTSDRVAPMFRIHELVRRTLRDRGDPRVSAADQALYPWFERRAADRVAGARTEALYHLSKLNAKAARESWFNQFSAAQDAGNFDLGLRLISIFDELGYEGGTRVSALTRIATFWIDAAAWEKAASAIVEAVALSRTAAVTERWGADSYLLSGNAELTRGRLLTKRGNVEPALEAFQSAIANYDQCASNEAIRSTALNNTGLAWQEIADLVNGTRDASDVAHAYTQAIDCFIAASEGSGSMGLVLRNVAVAQSKLAGLQFEQDLEGACKLLDAALENIGRAVALDPEEFGLHELHGYVHFVYAQGHFSKGNIDIADKHFHESIQCMWRSATPDAQPTIPPVAALAVMIGAAQLALASGDNVGAFGLAKLGRELLRKVPDSRVMDPDLLLNESAMHMILAECHRRAGRHALALARAQRAMRSLDHASETGLNSKESRIRKFVVEMYVRGRLVDSGRIGDLLQSLKDLDGRTPAEKPDESSEDLCESWVIRGAKLDDPYAVRLRTAVDSLLDNVLKPAFPTRLKLDRHGNSFIEKYMIELDVFFEHGQSEISEDDKAYLAALASRTENTLFEVMIVVGLAEAHEGESEFAVQALSVARAEAVKKSLVQFGLDARRVYCEGQGSKGAGWAVPVVNGLPTRRVAALEAIGTRVIA